MSFHSLIDILESAHRIIAEPEPFLEPTPIRCGHDDILPPQVTVSQAQEQQGYKKDCLLYDSLLSGRMDLSSQWGIMRQDQDFPKNNDFFKKHFLEKEPSPQTSQQKCIRFRPYQSDQWLERFEDLQSFKEEHKHCLVPHDYPENQQLAQWVKRQRYQYKLKMQGKHSTLTDVRQKQLEDFGFVWDSHKAAWCERLEALSSFHRQHGHCNVPATYPDRSLAVWVKCQRRQMKLYHKGLKSTMTPSRYQSLMELGFDWNPRKLR